MGVNANSNPFWDKCELVRNLWELGEIRGGIQEFGGKFWKSEHSIFHLFSKNFRGAARQWTANPRSKQSMNVIKMLTAAQIHAALDGPQKLNFKHLTIEDI